MPIERGEWWNSGSRPVMKARAGAVTADVEQGDLASCAVQAGNIAAGGVSATGQVADGIITSEKATSLLRARSVTVIVEKPTASSSGGWSSSYVVWRPLTAVNVLRVQGINLGVYENATCDILEVYGNAGTSISQISFKAVASTNIAAGTRTAGAAVNQAALAACTDVLIKLSGSTCSVPSRVAVAIDYESSG